MKTLRKVRAFVGRHYVLKRLLQMIPILFGITLLTFLIMKIAPGSPLQTMINPKLSMEDIQAAEDALGLNDPIYVQYFKWLGQILQGNLGYSVMSGRSVTDIITERIGPTLLLTLTSYAISLLFGLIFGIYSATHSGSVGDYILTVLAFIGVAVPSFFLALGSVYVFSLKLGWFPTGAMRTIGVELTGWSGFVDVVRHMTLPAIVMALPQTASITRYARSSMLDVIHEDFIRTARAKGLGEKRVIFVAAQCPHPDYHALRAVSAGAAGRIVHCRIHFQLAGFGHAGHQGHHRARVFRADGAEPDYRRAGAAGQLHCRHALHRSRPTHSRIQRKGGMTMRQNTVRAVKGESTMRRAAEKFCRNKLAVISLIILLVLILLAIFADKICTYDPLAENYKENGMIDKYSAPSAEHILGTDSIGRDVFARLLYGGRISLSVGLISCLISVAIGILAGCLACFGGRLADSLIMRTVDVVICFPVMFLIITISCFITPTIYTIMLIIGLVSWTGTARLVRGEILKIRELEYVQSSIVLGAGNVRIVFTHVLPNIIAPVVVQATLSIASAILTEASLSFLGVGVAPPTPSWGNMINAATNLTTLLNRPWIWLPPGLCILVTVLCINLIGDGLRDAFDAKTR